MVKNIAFVLVFGVGAALWLIGGAFALKARANNKLIPREAVMGQWYVKKHFKFDAAHCLERHKGKCKNLHGHTWHGWVSIAATGLDSQEMVVDFGDIKKMLEPIIEQFDHQDLNDVLNYDQPTSEFLAMYIFNKMKRELAGRPVRLVSVCIQETDGSEAVYHE